MKQFDERDMMFARMSMIPDSWQYEDYYKRHPEKKEVDEILRALPEMGQPGSAMYHPIHTKMADAAFAFLSDIGHLSEGKPAAQKVAVDPEMMTRRIKGLAQFYHADLVGITKMEPSHYYSHRGRHPVDYGKPILEHHTYGIAFAVAMDKEMLMTAPALPEMLATTRGYVEAATIGMVLAYFIRSLGYEARNHMDANYLVIAPQVAASAGLGEFGRNGMLITKEFGACVRLGVVTTNMPLIGDEAQSFGVAAFCEQCGRCAQTCPGKAICKAPQYDEEGRMQWKINSEECYRRFRSLGTDCGICIANCPFTYHIPSEQINRLEEEAVRTHILDAFREKYKLRPMNREPIEWLQEDRK